MSDTPHSVSSSAGRFVLAGGANTLVTGALLALLSLAIDPRLAYTVVFAAGIALSVFIADRFVYGVRMNRISKLAYIAMYVAVFLLGLAVVSYLTATGLSRGASGLVVLVTAPLTFLGGRLITSATHRARTPTTTEQG